MFRFHLFLCTQQKPEGVQSCPAAGSLSVLDLLSREIQARGLGSEVQLTTCGCMGLCDDGPVLVVYPDGVWYRRIQASTELLASARCPSEDRSPRSPCGANRVSTRSSVEFLSA
jgi:(2Fe-2S) ferredoxin